MCRSPAATTLVFFALIALTRSQYFDIFQGLQQFLQPYPQNDFVPQYNGFPRTPVTYTQENKKKIEQRSQERSTKKPPTNQYEYVFGTTQKPKRKQTKNNSSQSSSRTFSKNQYGNILFGDYIPPTYETTTRRIKTKPRTTTEANYYNNNYYNKPTTENVNYYKPTTTNNLNRPIIETNYENNRNNFGFKPNYRPDNNGAIFNNNFPNKNVNNNNNREIINTDYDPQQTYEPRPNIGISNGINTAIVNTGSNRNPNFGNNGNRSPISGLSPIEYDRPVNNKRVDFNPRGNNNQENINSFVYPTDNPLLNRPGVKPSYDFGQPITNRPVNNGFFEPSVPAVEKEDSQPEITLGVDEDDMTENQKRRYIELAERMCDRYKSLSVKKVVALPLLPSPEPVELNVTSCARINVPLIIGGKVVTIKEFPHMALVGWIKTRNAGYSWKCGGSLISDQFVLTAGHCTFQDRDYDVVSGPPQAVQLGSSYLDDPGAVVVRVTEVIRHPKYKMRRSYHDVALLKLAQSVTFSEVIRPACLGVPPREGENIVATGWGRTEFGGDHSQQLRSVSLPVWNMADCREIWGTSLKLPNGPTADSHVCAGERRGGKDTCQGDSGGPAVIQDGCAWRVLAVTSLGRACGAAGTPALYARVPRAFVAAHAFQS